MSKANINTGSSWVLKLNAIANYHIPTDISRQRKKRNDVAYEKNDHNGLKGQKITKLFNKESHGFKRADAAKVSNRNSTFEDDIDF